MRTHAIQFGHIGHSETNAAAYSHTVVGAASHRGPSHAPAVLLHPNLVGILPLVLLGLIVLVLPYTSEALS